jgi:hypothetical protein
MKAPAFLLLLVSLAFPEAGGDKTDFGIEVIQSPHTLRSLRIAPTLAHGNWRFSPGSYLYMEAHGTAKHSVDPLFGLAFAAVAWKIDQSDNPPLGALAGLFILGGLTCLPNAEYTVPVSVAGISPGIFWSYNLLPVSWRGGDIDNVKKIGLALRKRFGRFDVSAHCGVSDKGFGDEPGPTFGFGSTFFIGKFRSPLQDGGTAPE